MHLLLLFPLLFWLSGSSAVIRGPGEVSGPERGSLTVQCCYDPGWENYKKYWCQGAEWSDCKILVRTTGSERERKKDRVSIRDNQTSCVFTVTMEKLRGKDAGTYWCGIEKNKYDHGHGVPVKVTVGPGSSAVIRGPGEVNKPEGGSLTVQCRYDPGWENYKKYWCRGAEWSDCKILVRTTGSEREVKEDRMSIRDNQTSCVFTVTMEKLRQEDAGTYWCGIERAGTDHGVPVKVTVGPATTTVSTTIPTTTFTVPVTTEAPTSSPTVTSQQPHGSSGARRLHARVAGLASPEASVLGLRTAVFSPCLPVASPVGLLSSVHFLLLVFLKLPLFLSMLGAVLWVNRPQRGSGEGGPPHSENQ